MILLTICSDIKCYCIKNKFCFDVFMCPYIKKFYMLSKKNAVRNVILLKICLIKKFLCLIFFIFLSTILVQLHQFIPQLFALFSFLVLPHFLVPAVPGTTSIPVFLLWLVVHFFLDCTGQ